MTFTRLFEPGNIGKMVVPNRTVMPGIGTHSGNQDGTINDQTTYYYEVRARGGVGLVITQGLRFVPNSGFPGNIMIDEDKYIPGLKDLVDRVHRYGSKICCQLSHSGVMSHQFYDAHDSEHKGSAILGASAIPCVTYGTTPRAMTHEEIKDHVEFWSNAAERAKRAGFDTVEIHAAHGYFLSGFLSSYQNRRTDKYGGSIENRARFACEVLARTREKVGPDFPIMIRINGSDFFEGGTTLEEAVAASQLFVEAGADCIDVSCANQDSRQWRDLTYLFPDAAIVYTAEAIKKAVKVPVVAVGKIGHPALAESILREGKADFVAFGRALLANADFVNKSREGRLDDITYCIYCNNCRLTHGNKAVIAKKGAGLSCTVNPALLRERQFEIKPVARPKKVMVAGGGIAGMEAAMVLKERGHNVTLYEKTDRLGGLWNIVVLDENKTSFKTVTDYLARQLRRLEVPIKLGSEVTPELVKKEKPDAVVVATGAVPHRLDIPGIDGKQVIQATDVFTGKARIGEKVVVIGGRLVGMEVAIKLAKEGKKVSLVTMRALGENGVPPERNVFVVLRERLQESNVAVYTHSPVMEITDRGVFFVWGKEIQFVRADTVVLAVGMQPDHGLLEKLRGSAQEVYAAGDCVEARNALEAINEAAEAAYNI